MTWQPIETAPKDGTPIMLFATAEGFDAPVVTVGWLTVSRRWIEGTFYPNTPTTLIPTHWMPLPAPPATPAEFEVVSNRELRGPLPKGPGC